MAALSGKSARSALHGIGVAGLLESETQRYRILQLEDSSGGRRAEWRKEVRTSAKAAQKRVPARNGRTGKTMSAMDGDNRLHADSKGRGAGDAQKKGGDPGAAGNVDKIRDILFGSQMRDYDTRFARLEETLLKESADLRDSTRKRIETLENYVRKELESLALRLKSEREERAGADRQLAAEGKSLGESLSKKIEDVHEEMGEGQAQLRKQLLEQSKSLSEEIREKQEELSALIERRYQELRSQKTDRAALAGMLTEVALRLNDEFQIPDAEQ
jgi:hypothetical protein